jgi:hypothetical protein
MGCGQGDNRSGCGRRLKKLTSFQSRAPGFLLYELNIVHGGMLCTGRGGKKMVVRSTIFHLKGISIMKISKFSGSKVFRGAKKKRHGKH